MIERTLATLAGWAGWPLLIIVCLLTFLAPAAESRFMPVRIHQSVGNVVRGDGELCFDWTSTKVRAKTSDNVDVFLHVWEAQDGHMIEVDRSATSIYSKATRKPWARSSALPPTGKPQVQTYCTALPPFIRPDMPVQLEMMAYYPGLLPIWHSTLQIPTVTDPAGAAL